MADRLFKASILSFFVFILGVIPLRADTIPHHTAFTRSKGEPFILGTGGLFPAFTSAATDLFDNPAFLAELKGVEVGFSGSAIGAEPVYYFSAAGSFLENSAAGIGVSHLQDPEGSEQTILLSYAASMHSISAGLNTKFMTSDKLESGTYDKRLSALDFDAGLILNLHEYLFFGLLFTNFLANNIIDNKEQSISSERSAKIQFALLPLDNHRISIFAEALADSFHSTNIRRYALSGGVEGSPFQERIVRIRAGFTRENNRDHNEHENILMGGMGFYFPLGDNELRLEYGLNMLLSDHSSATTTIRHAVGLHYNFKGREDDTPPFANFRTDTKFFTPGPNPKTGVIRFFLEASDPGGTGVRKWAFTISEQTPKGKTQYVKSFTGTGIPPRVLEWDGRNSEGSLADSGDYIAQFRVIDKAHNHTDSPFYSFQIR